MKILLTGRNGQVGWELERRLHGLGELVPTDRETLNLSEEAEVLRVVRELKPTLIVNAGAYTAVDRAESEVDLATKINGVAPGILADEARRVGGLLVHYSTDYIFDGTKRVPYSEDDAPNPINVYGVSKLEGERRVMASGARHLIIRTSWVYGARGKNFFVAIAERMRRGEPLRVVNDQRGVPSESSFVADVTLSLLERAVEGTFNVVPGGETTWHGFAMEIARRLGVSAEVAAISTDQHRSVAKRPAYSVLDSMRLRGELGSLPSWEDLLDGCVARWKLAQA